MRKVIIDYSKKSMVYLITLATNVSEKLYAVPEFTAAPVTKTNFDLQIEKTKNAMVAAANFDRELLAALRNSRAVLIQMLNQNAQYVNAVCPKGNEQILLSSGYEVTRTPEKNQLPEAVTKISARYTDLNGTIALNWKRTKRANYYHVFMSSDNGQTWQLLKSEFSRKMLVQNLASGVRYKFKVVPVGLHGTGPESQEASQIAA